MNRNIRHPGARSIVVIPIVLLVLGLIVGSSRAAPDKGAQALLRNAERLELTQRQIEKIRAIVRVTSREFNRIGRAERGQPDLPSKLDGVRKQAQEKALALLTTEQRERWGRLNSRAPADSQKRRSAAEQIAARSLIIPTIKEMKNPPYRGAFGPSAAITKTRPHPTLGENYVILTDHTDETALRSLNRLARHRNGSVLNLNSLGTLYKTPLEYARVQSVLKRLKPGCVAIAPRSASYRENMHLSMLRLLAGLDEDPSIDAFFGYLMASDPQRLSELVERTLRAPREKRETPRSTRSLCRPTSRLGVLALGAGFVVRSWPKRPPSGFRWTSNGSGINVPWGGWLRRRRVYHRNCWTSTAGELQDDASPRALAHAVCAMACGVCTMGRAGMSKATVRDAIHMNAKLIDSLAT